MSKFKVGDRVMATGETTRWVCHGDLGTVTVMAGDALCVLWDEPRRPHVDDEGWWYPADDCIAIRRPSLLRRLFGLKEAA